MNNVDVFFKALNPKLFQERKEAEKIAKRKIVAMVDKAYSEYNKRRNKTKNEK